MAGVTERLVLDNHARQKGARQPRRQERARQLCRQEGSEVALHQSTSNKVKLVIAQVNQTLYGLGKNNNIFIILIAYVVLICRQLRMPGRRLELIYASLHVKTMNQRGRWLKEVRIGYHRKLLMPRLIACLLVYKQ